MGTRGQQKGDWMMNPHPPTSSFSPQLGRQMIKSPSTPRRPRSTDARTPNTISKRISSAAHQHPPVGPFTRYELRATRSLTES